MNRLVGQLMMLHIDYIALRNIALDFRLYKDILLQLSGNIDLYGFRSAFNNFNSTVPKITGEGYFIGKCPFTSFVNIIQANRNRNIGTSQSADIGTLAVDGQIHRMLRTGSQHKSTVIEGALAQQLYLDIVESILNLGILVSNHVQP